MVTRMTIMKIGLSGIKMTIISIHHFVPHPVINHIKMDKCLFTHTNFYPTF